MSHYFNELPRLCDVIAPEARRAITFHGVALEKAVKAYWLIRQNEEAPTAAISAPARAASTPSDVVVPRTCVGCNRRPVACRHTPCLCACMCKPCGAQAVGRWRCNDCGGEITGMDVTPIPAPAAPVARAKPAVGAAAPPPAATAAASAPPAVPVACGGGAGTGRRERSGRVCDRWALLVGLSSAPENPCDVLRAVDPAAAIKLLGEPKDGKKKKKDNDKPRQRAAGTKRARPAAPAAVPRPAAPLPSTVPVTSGRSAPHVAEESGRRLREVVDAAMAEQRARDHAVAPARKKRKALVSSSSVVFIPPPLVSDRRLRQADAAAAAARKARRAKKQK